MTMLGDWRGRPRRFWTQHDPAIVTGVNAVVSSPDRGRSRSNPPSTPRSCTRTEQSRNQAGPHALLTRTLFHGPSARISLGRFGRQLLSVRIQSSGSGSTIAEIIRYPYLDRCLYSVVLAIACTGVIRDSRWAPGFGLGSGSACSRQGPPGGRRSPQGTRRHATDDRADRKSG